MLVAVGGASLTDEQVASFTDVADVRSILAALEQRGLLRTDERGRRAVPTGLIARLRGALDVVETADRVLGQLISIAKDGRLTIDDLDAVLGITRWAAGAERLSTLLELVTEVERAITLSRRVEVWLEVVHQARRAARTLGDQNAEAWADDQLRACERALGRPPTTRAARVGEAAETVALRSTPAGRPLWLVRAAAATLALAAAGVAGYAVASAGDDAGGGALTTTLAGEIVTVGGTTFTQPGSTITAAGSTITVPGDTLTLTGETVTLSGDTVTVTASTTTVTTTVTPPFVP